MHYEVTIGDAKLDVEVLPRGTGYDVRVGGQPVDVTATRVPGGFLLRFGDAVLDVVVGGEPSAPYLASGDLRARAQIESEKQKALRARRRTQLESNAKVIESPMHGRVVKILVAVGDQVAAGQPVAIVEAMKMENEIRARSAGHVLSIHVAAGDNVHVKTTLVVLT